MWDEMLSYILLCICCICSGCFESIVCVVFPSFRRIVGFAVLKLSLGCTCNGTFTDFVVDSFDLDFKVVHFGKFVEQFFFQNAFLVAVVMLLFHCLRHAVM